MLASQERSGEGLVDCTRSTRRPGCVLWFGSGLSAARALHVNQSTISRHVKAVLKEMELERERRPAFCMLLGDLELLQAERALHQLALLKGRAPLRIDGMFVSGPCFLGQLPPDWMLGSFDLPGMERPLELLEQRMIDAWVGSYHPDLPDADDPVWWVVDLLRTPLQLQAAPDHPLAGERRLSQGELTRFPSLALPAGW